MYPLCYFVLTVNLNKRLTSILREVNINGYNTCILSIIGAAYLYIWGAFKPYDTKAQITHQLSKVFCTYARASSVAMYCKRGRISEEDWFFSRNWLSFLFWHWSSIRVLRIKPIWENRLVFKWGKYFRGWCSNWPGAVLYFVDDGKIIDSELCLIIHGLQTARGPSILEVMSR